MIDELIQETPMANAFAERAVIELGRMINRDNPSFNPKDDIQWRVKLKSAILAKLKRHRDINDFIGIRVLVSHLGLIADTEEKIRKWAEQLELEQVEYENSFDHPDESGYRAIHIDYRFLHPENWKLSPMVSIEVQLTTHIQNSHGKIAEQFYYRYYKIDVSHSVEVQLFLNGLSKGLHEIDADVMMFFEAQNLESRGQKTANKNV